MPGRPHHSDKWHRCWSKVQGLGHDPQSAAAICSSALLGSGQDIYKGKGSRGLPSSKKAKAARKARNAEGVMPETRQVHLMAAAGKIRTMEYQKRSHIVMSVTALVEGVLHAVNSTKPELVLAEEFSIAAPSWNGRPVMMNHPEVNGQKVSANNPRILEEFSMGHVFNTHVADGKLVMEAWIDKERAKSMGGDAMRTLERIEAADPADPIEVSVGVFMVSEDGKGIKNGKPYQAIWRHITPDHLAILPEGKTGACSVAMGCGVHHYLATAQGYQEVGMGEKTPSLWERLKGLVQGQSVPSDETIRAALSETESDQDQRQALQMELQKEEPNAYITMVYADRIIYGLTDSSMGGAMTYYQLGYAGDEKTGYTFDEDPIEVEQVTSFEPVTAAIAAADGCHCHEGEPDMTKSERIKALLALPNNPVKDAKVLEAAPDDVLKTLEDHAAKLDADQKAAKDATDAAAAAKTTADAAQSALKAAEAVAAAAAVAATKELTEEEFLRTAPPAIRTMVQRHKDADAKAHGELVASLKTAQKVHSEDALKAKSLEQLQEIAALLQMPPVDYSLRAVPRAAEASADGEYKSQPPPDGYKLALEKRAAASASRH